MKVVLKHTIIDAILASLGTAGHSGRKADYVMVTPNEYIELCGDIRSNSYLSRCYSYSTPKNPAPMDVRVRDFRRIRNSSDESYRHLQDLRVLSNEQFAGVDLYVVPVEYESR